MSPYGAYNGLRSCVYQPTELALIAKGLTKVSVVYISDTNPPPPPSITSTIIMLLCVNSDRPAHTDPSSHSPVFEPRKWRLPDSLSQLLEILRTVTDRHCDSSVHCTVTYHRVCSDIRIPSIKCDLFPFDFLRKAFHTLTQWKMSFKMTLCCRLPPFLLFCTASDVPALLLKSSTG